MALTEEQRKKRYDQIVAMSKIIEIMDTNDITTNEPIVFDFDQDPLMDCVDLGKMSTSFGIETSFEDVIVDAIIEYHRWEADPPLDQMDFEGLPFDVVIDVGVTMRYAVFITYEVCSDNLMFFLRSPDKVSALICAWDLYKDYIRINHEEEVPMKSVERMCEFEESLSEYRELKTVCVNSLLRLFSAFGLRVSDPEVVKCMGFG